MCGGWLWVLRMNLPCVLQTGMHDMILLREDDATTCDRIQSIQNSLMFLVLLMAGPTLRSDLSDA
jgi:hypothetical protein